MNNTEKLVVLRLVHAVAEYRKPQRYKVSLPPAFGEMEARAAECEAIRLARETELDAAITTVMQAIQ